MNVLYQLLSPASRVAPLQLNRGHAVGRAALSESLLSQMMGSASLMPFINDASGANLDRFLNDTVHVHPSPEVIARNTTVFTGSASEDNNCSICLDELEHEQALCRINHCGHAFHEQCIMTWFQSNVRCPACRHDVRDA
jgi:hypothetical protein